MERACEAIQCYTIYARPPGASSCHLTQQIYGAHLGNDGSRSEKIFKQGGGDRRGRETGEGGEKKWGRQEIQRGGERRGQMGELQRGREIHLPFSLVSLSLPHLSPFSLFPLSLPYLSPSISLSFPVYRSISLSLSPSLPISFSHCFSTLLVLFQGK